MGVLLLLPLSELLPTILPVLLFIRTLRFLYYCYNFGFWPWNTLCLINCHFDGVVDSFSFNAFFIFFSNSYHPLLVWSVVMSILCYRRHFEYNFYFKNEHSERLNLEASKQCLDYIVFFLTSVHIYLTCFYYYSYLSSTLTEMVSCNCLFSIITVIW